MGESLGAFCTATGTDGHEVLDLSYLTAKSTDDILTWGSAKAKKGVMSVIRNSNDLYRIEWRQKLDSLAYHGYVDSIHLRYIDLIQFPHLIQVCSGVGASTAGSDSTRRWPSGARGVADETIPCCYGCSVPG